MTEIKTIEMDFVNAFLVKAKDGFVLIDTGMPQHWEKIAMHQADSLMAKQGVRTKRTIRTLHGKLVMLMARLHHRNMSFEKFKPDLYLKDGQIGGFQWKCLRNL